MDTRDRALHFHDLKRMARSPAHCLAGFALDESDKASFRFGRLSHKVLLGGDYVVYKDGDRRGKKWEEFQAAHPGADIFKPDEEATALRMAEAVLNHPIASALVKGEHELPVEWDMLGRRVATRGIDILNRGGRFLTEYKTASTTEPHAFQRGALRYGYHAQLAMYVDAARSLGVDIEDTYVVAVETSAPFAVTVLHPTWRLLEEGRKCLRSWMERFIACEEAGEWPAYVQSIVEWDVVEDEGLLLIDGEEVAA